MSTKMLSYYIAAAHKSSGKTSISIGLSRAISRLGTSVQCFKKGPDYIDPIWLRAASRNPCYNLDFNTQSHHELMQFYAQHSKDSDIIIIEGNKGLYDGVDLHGADSNAAMVKLLKVPVILTIDTVGITRGIAPLLQGYQNFDTDIEFAGVILNKVGTSRHESKLRAAVEYYTDFKVLGAIGFDNNIAITERHLGLQPANENDSSEHIIENLADAIYTQINIETLIKHSTEIELDATPKPNKTFQSENIDSKCLLDPFKGLKIAVARDAAFGFYYDDDLELFTKLGVELTFIDMIQEQHLPEVDGLFIGGGFPETRMPELSKNKSMMGDVKNAINNGLPCYAECGGLMYLSKSIQWQDDKHSMVGVIPGDILMQKKPQGRGYAKLIESKNMLWTDTDVADDVADVINAHEFHYASLENLPADSKFAYDVARGFGINGQSDGIIIKNLLANFSHLRSTAQHSWVERFLTHVHQCKNIR